MSKPSYFTLAILLVCLHDSCQQREAELNISQIGCPTGGPYDGVGGESDDRGLSFIVNLAGAIRHSMEPKDIPLEKIKKAFKEWNGDLDTIGEAFSEASRTAGLDIATNALFSGSFTLLLSLATPLLFIILGRVLPRIWKLERDPEEGEEESSDCNDEEKNSTFVSQIAAWLLGVGLLVSCVLVLVFVSILMAGNQRTREGINRSTAVASGIIAELIQARDSAIVGLNDIHGQFSQTLEELQRKSSNHLKVLRESDSLHGDSMKDAAELVGEFQKSYREGKLSDLYPVIDIICNVSKMLDDLFNNYLDPLLDKLKEIVGYCENYVNRQDEIVQNATTNICHHLLENKDMFAQYKRNKTGVFLSNFTRFSHLAKEARNLLHYKFNDSWHLVYSAEVVAIVNETWQSHFRNMNTFEANLVTLVEQVKLEYSTVSLNATFGDMLSTLTGERYLLGWSTIQYGTILTLSLVLLSLVVLLVVVAGMGLLYIFNIYKCGHDTRTAAVATHFSTIMQRIVTVLYCSCVVLGLASFILLPAATTLGSLCGPKENFSSLTETLLDDVEIWGGVYPLAAVLLGNPSTPLSLTHLLNSCSWGGSLYLAFKLNTSHSLNHLPVMYNEIDVLKEKVKIFQLPKPSILGVNNTKGLGILLKLLRIQFPEKWPELFVSNFTSFVKEVLTNMSKSADSGNIQYTVSNASILANQSHTKVMWMEDDPLNAKEYLKKIQSDQLKTPFIRMLDKQEKIVTAVNSTVAPFLHSNVTRWLQGVVDNHLGEFVSAISPSIYCSFGSCKNGLQMYTDFMSASCRDVLHGMDVVWSLSIWLICLLIAMLLCTIPLSKRFEYPSSKLRFDKFYFPEVCLQQFMFAVLYCTGSAIDGVFISAIYGSSDFHSKICSEDSNLCCPNCVWSFAILLLCICVGVVFVLFVYQCYLIHWTKASVDGRRQNFWFKRHLAVKFYTKLFILCIQDLFFFLLGVVYMSYAGHVTLSSLVVLVWFLAHFIIFLTTFMKERRAFPLYWNCLKNEAKTKANWLKQCVSTPSPPPSLPPPPNETNRPEELEMVEVPYIPGSVVDADDRVDSHGPTPLPPYRDPSNSSQGAISVSEDSDDGSDTECPSEGNSTLRRPVHRPLSIVVLDQPFESDCDEAALRRTEGLKARENGGIDVVKLPSFDLLYDSSTIRSGSYQSIKWGSDSYSTCAPSSLAHLTSCDDMSDYEDFRHKKIRSRLNFSGDLTYEV